MPRDEDVFGVLAAVFLGLVGLAILASIFGPRCPRCRRPVEREARVCPHCGAWLEW